MVSKPQIRFKGKAPADEKAQHTWSYVSILKRLATQPLDVRWGFETTSNSDRGLSNPTLFFEFKPLSTIKEYATPSEFKNDACILEFHDF